MERRTQYLLGWADASIHEFLLGMDAPPEEMAFALITCLDSSLDVAGILKGGRPASSDRLDVTPLGWGAIVLTLQLVAAERRQRRFFGFDELWFFARPPRREKPAELIITGPEPIMPGTVQTFETWMNETQCVLGLGDGTGLNYCLRVPSAAGGVVRLLNEVLPRGADKRASA